MRHLTRVFLSTYRSLYELSYGKEMIALEQFSQNLKQYQQHLSLCAQKEKEQWTFLQRVRSLRWQIYICQDTFRTLSHQLSTNMTTLGTMNALLQSRCHINILSPHHPNNTNNNTTTKQSSSALQTPSSLFFDGNHTNHNNNLQWATPSATTNNNNNNKEGEEDDVNCVSNNNSSGNEYDVLPYPKFYLDYEYESKELAQKDKATVQFNRLVLMNGFRRLQALETIAHHQVKRNTPHGNGKANPLKPTILLQTLSNNNNNNNNNGSIMAACLSPPDGRRVAVACDDGSVSIYNSNSTSGNNSTNSTQVLLGHFHGLPVYDLHWNPNGRHLITCGGDGTIRLWDTMAVGPHGKLATTTTTTATAHNNKSSTNHNKTNAAKLPKKITLDQSLVPHTKGSNGGVPTTPMVQVQGAMLATFKSSPTPCPITCVQFAPCGYYFASADGQTGMAKIWVTDRSTPVRILVGHLAGTIYKIKWHPNCNYLFTSSDDQTIRMWDVQTGKCVRLFFATQKHNKQHSSTNSNSNSIAIMSIVHTSLEVSPCGQYLAGADQHGTITIWNVADSSIHHQYHHDGQISMIYSMSYSSCGTALASAGEDGYVRIWNTTQDDQTMQNEFATKHTMLLHLIFTKRNLLLSVGKYAGPSTSASSN